MGLTERLVSASVVANEGNVFVSRSPVFVQYCDSSPRTEFLIVSNSSASLEFFLPIALREKALKIAARHYDGLDFVRRLGHGQQL